MNQKVRSTRAFHNPTVRILVYLTAALALLCLVQLPSFGGEKTRPRPISELTLNERMNLPENTQVTLKSGRTTTLAEVRAEHRARMESLAKAAALGRALAAKLKASANSAVAISKGTVTPAAGAIQPSAVAVPSAAQQKGGLAGRTQAESSPQRKAGNAVAAKNAITAAGPNALNLAKMVPMPDLSSKSPSGILPKDYRDFCQAADPSACIYVPSNITFYIEWTHEVGDKSTYFLLATDPLIMDPGVCAYDGGSLDPTLGCIFYYPMLEVINFIPKPPLSSSASCDSTATYLVDPKGAIQVKVTAPQFSSGNFTVPLNAPITCAVQVWLAQ